MWPDLMSPPLAYLPFVHKGVSALVASLQVSWWWARWNPWSYSTGAYLHWQAFCTSETTVVLPLGFVQIQVRRKRAHWATWVRPWKSNKLRLEPMLHQNLGIAKTHTPNPRKNSKESSRVFDFMMYSLWMAPSHTARPISGHSFTLVAIMSCLSTPSSLLNPSGEHPVPAIIEHLQHYGIQGLVLQQVPCDTTSRKSGEGIEVHAWATSKGRGTYYWKKIRHIFDKRKMVFHTVAEFLPSTVVLGTFLLLDHMIGKNGK